MMGAPAVGSGAQAWRTALLVTLGFVALRLPYLLHGYNVNDEGVYAVVTTEWMDGGKLYINALERRPPLLFAAYAAAFAVGGAYNMVALHVASTLWVLLTMLGLATAARRLFGARAALPAAVLYGIYGGWGDYTNLAWNGELLLNLPLAWAVAIAFGPGRSRARPELFVAGALVACGFLFKQPAAAAAVALGVYLLLPTYRRARGLSLRHALLQAGLFTLGFFAVLAAAAWYLHAQGILSDALYWIFRHHDMPYGPGTVIFWERLTVAGVLFTLCCFPLLAAATVALAKNSRWMSWQGKEAERTAVLLLLATAMLGVGASGRFYRHYFLLLIPALVLAAAPIVAGLLSSEGPEGPWPLQRRAMRRVLVATAIAFFVVQAVGLAKRANGSDAARYVRAHSTRADWIFVWGELPRVYLEAQRRPSSRFVCTYPLTGYPYGGSISYDPEYHDTSGRIVPGAWETLERELEARPPRFIVDAEAAMQTPRYPFAKFPSLARLIAQHYRKVYTARDAVVYERAPDRADHR